MNLRGCVLLCGLLPVLVGSPVHAQSDDCTEIGTVVSAQGSVRVQASGSENWRRVERQSKVCEGDRVQTGSRSRAAIKLANESLIRVRQQSEATLENFADERATTSLMRLVTGVIQFFSRKPQEYSIRTTTATIGIRGTEFVVSVTDGATRVAVYEGEVQAENDVAPVTLRGGETVTIESGRSPRAERIVDGRDQVQWGLYYPPVLALDSDSDDDLEESLACANRGDFDCAFEAADNVPTDGRDAAWRVHLAALLLAVGDVEAAGDNLTGALFEDPNNAAALALEAVVGLVQGRTEAARSSARAAVTADPDSAAARIALSYVLQAELNLDGARAQLQIAVEREPENTLARARLAELELALGNHGAARAEAARAVALDPDLSRVHMVAGYAALAEIDTAAAAGAFERALELDDADPMAHLGLGLALIRRGELVAGRIEIEAAVALDSSSAILRPYLGRAYYEEKRSPLDTEQYAMAKQLDPEDPTAYLFDALRLHSESRPVEARAELEASIERNDNRAVYRGRNLLDQDRAARGASLAQIYETLGFAEQGINVAADSLATDPANASAHRFLSDSYLQIRRREIARVSELLQAQMLQEINVNPLQPSVSSTNINLGTGAGAVGLNEFTALFEANGVQPSVSLLSGSNDTTGAEAVVSGIYNSLSFSLGGFSYESDGWRDNNGIDQDLGNLFVQWAATPQLNLQAEISTRESTEGDLAFDFDPDNFDPNLTHDRDFDTERLGIRYSPSPKMDFLLSHIESERSENRTTDGETFGGLAADQLAPIPGQITPAPCPLPPLLFFNCFPLIGEFPREAIYDSIRDLTNDSSQSEFQYIWKAERFKLVAGLAVAEVDSVNTEISDAPEDEFVILLGPPDGETTEDSSLEHDRFYIYSTFAPSSSVDLTIGVSTDDYNDSQFAKEVSQENAKLGMKWRLDERQTLRAAAFAVTKPALANNRTLEPTQIAGFNQFFDDINATHSEIIGLAYDIRINQALTAGAEFTSREKEFPFRLTVGTTVTTEFERQDEERGRIYVNWTPSKSVAFSAQLITDVFESEEDDDANKPLESTTDSLPLSLKYFSSNRWFAGITATMVEQKVETKSGATSLVGGEDDFTVVDLSFGYRLAKRQGSVSLVIHNAGDEEFEYLDDSYREFRDEPSIGPYFPERTAFLQANLVF